MRSSSSYVVGMLRPDRLIGCIACLVALCCASASTAATLYVVQSGPEAWTVLDPESIEVLPGPGVQRRAWIVRVQRNILTGNPPQPGYVRTLFDYDCEQTRARWREFSAFSRSGAGLISKRNPNPEWGPATEAADIHAAFQVVCRGGGGGSVVSADSLAKLVISLMASWDPPPATPSRPLPLAKPSAKPPANVPPPQTTKTNKPKAN